MADNVWYWEIETKKGTFYITVMGHWSQEEAADNLWQLFKQEIRAPIIGLVPRKRINSMAENAGTVYEKENGEVSFLGGRKFFQVVGREALYDAEKVALDKQLGRKA